MMQYGDGVLEVVGVVGVVEIVGVWDAFGFLSDWEVMGVLKVDGIGGDDIRAVEAALRTNVGLYTSPVSRANSWSIARESCEIVKGIRD